MGGLEGVDVVALAILSGLFFMVGLVTGFLAGLIYHREVEMPPPSKPSLNIERIRLNQPQNKID